MLVVEGISKTFDGNPVLTDVSFSVSSNEFFSILGPSGCGKTTLLRILTGIESVDVGRVLLSGKDITNEKPSRRGMGLVFQDYSLFPNMTVNKNIRYALKFQKKNNNSALVQEIIKKTELTNLLQRYPRQLSGGQQQRVAIARTLVLTPNIILMDEPFSALDVTLRLSLKKLIKSLQKDLGLTIIYVSHEQEDALTMADKVMVLKNGTVQQVATPRDIYTSPANDFVSKFVRKHIDEKSELLRSITHDEDGAAK